MFLGFGLINTMCSKHEPPKPVPSPVAYVPTAEERAAQAKQAASDAKFWAAKNAKDRDEVESYNKAQEPIADARANAAQYIPNSVYIQRSAPVQRSGFRGYSQRIYQQEASPTYRRVRGEDGAPKTQHVSSYTRKDGTHVNSYSRRPSGKVH